MNEFFDSDIVREELEVINSLQEKIYPSLFNFGFMTREQRLENIEMLTELLDKQQVMYTRLSLSDDPKAIELKENLRKSVSLMGFQPETDMSSLFKMMKATIDSLKVYVDT